MLDVELWTVRELAKALRVSQRQCWKLVKEHRIPGPIRLGRSVRWRVQDIRDFVEAGADMQCFAAHVEARQ